MADKKFIGKALQELINKEGVSQNKFANKLNLSSGNLSAVLRGDNFPRAQFFIVLKNEYPNLNLERFFTGEGPLFHDLSNKPETLNLDAGNLHLTKRLNLVLAVLESKTAVADVLNQQINATYQAMQNELELNKMKEKLGEGEPTKRANGTENNSEM